MSAQMYRQRTSLNEALATLGDIADVGSLVGVNAMMSQQVRLAVEALGGRDLVGVSNSPDHIITDLRAACFRTWKWSDIVVIHGTLPFVVGVRRLH